MSCPHGEWHEEDCAICVAENDTDEVDELRQAMRNLSSKYNELSVENELMKCCGNCEHHEYWGEGEDCKAVNGAVLVACFDPCHFTPSRWTRGET